MSVDCETRGSGESDTGQLWQGFCRVIGNPAWTNSPKFSTLLSRKENEDELDRLIDEWTINYSAEEMMSMMQAAGVPAGVLQTGEGLLEHPEIGMYRAPGHSFVLTKSPSQLQRAPLLGEHNEYVLKRILSMSDEEIAELVIEGVVE